MRFLLVCFTLLWLSAVVFGESSGVNLNSMSIVVAADAPVTERQAALDLQAYLEKITAQKPLLVKSAGTGPMIYVGQSDAVKKLLPDVKFDELEANEIIIKTIGKDTLVLTGGRPYGTIWAVYTFLEDTLGVRWWTATEQMIPSYKNLMITTLDVRYKPPFAIRDTYFHDTNTSSTFCVQLKLNGQYAHLPSQYGGSLYALGGGHTFQWLIPPKKYFSAHPEWFAMINGKRQNSTQVQLCLTNDDLRQELTKNAIQWLRKNPTCKLISVSQNDNMSYCQCPVCQAAAEKLGSQTDLLIDFVNKVAADLEQERPGVIVDTFAYQYSCPPPKTIKPRANLQIRLCSIQCNFAYPLESKHNEARFGQPLQHWNRLAEHLGIWNYLVNYGVYVWPVPNIRYFAADLRFLAKQKINGVIEQGQAECGGAGDFEQLRAWLAGHLLWNPQQDQDKLVSEFLNGYYGAAAPYIRQYYDLLHDEVDKNHDIDLNCYRFDTCDWLSWKTLLQAYHLMEQAQAAVAQDQTLRARVERTKLSIDFALLSRPEVSRWAPMTASGIDPHKLDLKKILDETLDRAKRYKILSYGEPRPEGDDRRFSTRENYENFLRNNIAETAPTDIPACYRQLKHGNWVEIPTESLTLTNAGSLVFKVNDATASAGTALRMPATHNSWVINTSLPFFRGEQRWEVLAAVRCDAVNPTGKAIRLGVYQSKVIDKYLDIDAAACVGKDYKFFSLGKINLKYNMKLYLAPCKNSAVKDVFVDRLFLVRR